MSTETQNTSRSITFGNSLTRRTTTTTTTTTLTHSLTHSLSLTVDQSDDTKRSGSASSLYSSSSSSSSSAHQPRSPSPVPRRETKSPLPPPSVLGQSDAAAAAAAAAVLTLIQLSDDASAGQPASACTSSGSSAASLSSSAAPEPPSSSSSVSCYLKPSPLSLTFTPCSPTHSQLPGAPTTSLQPTGSSSSSSSSSSSIGGTVTGTDIVAQLRGLSHEHPFLDIPQPSGHGQPLRVMLVPRPRIGSADASDRTLRHRSHLIEQITTAISVPQAAIGSPDEQRHVRAQLVHTVKRSRDTYEAVVRKAGLDVHVRCGPEEMVELKAITGMPYGAQRVLRTFLQSKGIDVLIYVPASTT